MKCPHCKKEIPDQAQFCGFCGNKIVHNEANDGKQKSGKKKALIVFIAAAICIGISSIAVISLMTRKESEKKTDETTDETTVIDSEESEEKIEPEKDTTEPAETVTFDFAGGELEGAATITGLDKNKQSVWTITTEVYPLAEFLPVEEIGIHEERYYYVEYGTIVAVNLADGKELWRNDEFGGAGIVFDFDEENTLYISGHELPDLFVVDKDGKTVQKLEDMDREYCWPNKIEYQEEQIAITFEGDGDYNIVNAVFYVDPKDYTYINPEKPDTDGKEPEKADSITEQEVYEKLAEYYKQGTEDSDGADLTVMEGSVNGSVYSTMVRCAMPGNPSASQLLYEVQVDMTNGNATQTRVLTDNQVTTFNLW